jgi:hypothetical protein
MMTGMTPDDRTRSLRPPLRRFWAWFERSGILIPAVFLALMAWLAPISYPAEFDTDEGVNLMKALLVSRGHALYTEIWSDQPPILTHLLAQTIRLFGPSVTSARTLILLFSALLVWSFFQAVRLSTSRAGALLGVLLLLCSAWYVRLSIAAMVGLPALALTMLSAYLFLLSRSRGRIPFLLASAVTLALGMQTKLLAGLLVPVLLAYALFVDGLDGSRPSTSRRRLLEGSLWLAVLLGSFTVVGFLFRSLDFRQLVQPHLGSEARSVFAADNLPAVRDLLVREIGLLPFAIVGVIWAFRKRRRTVWLPVGWSLMALAFLLYEKPLWYHHAATLTVPLAWVAAFGADAWILILRRWSISLRVSSGTRPGAAAGAGLVGLAGVVCLYLAIFDPVTLRPRVLGELFGLTPPYNEEVAAFIRQGFAGRPGWVFTDRPIYAFRAGLSVPPPIAALTVKRMRSAALSDPEMAAVLDSYLPDVVVLERFLPDYGPDFRSTLAAGYEPVLMSSTTEAWLPALPPALRGGSSGAGFQKYMFGDWLTLAIPDGALATRVRAGDDLRLDGLWWLRSEDHGAPSLAVSMRLVDEAGQVWSQRDTSVGTELVDLRGRPHVPQSLSVPVPEDLPAGSYQVVLVVYDPQTAQPLASAQPPGSGRTYASLGSVTVDKPSRDSSVRSLFGRSSRALADFGSVRLLRAETPARLVSPGDSVPVALTWQAGSRFGGEPLVVVVQLLDNRDRVVAGLEEEPLSGRYPTSRWQPGELVGDRHVLGVPSDVPPGRYRLVIGLYRAADRSRLSARGGLLGLLTRPYFTLGFVEVR